MPEIAWYAGEVKYVSKVIRVRYEDGVLKPLERLEAREGEVLLVKIVGRELAEKVFGSIRVSRERLDQVLRGVEDELGIY